MYLKAQRIVESFVETVWLTCAGAWFLVTDLYGAAFYFDEEVAFARCQSMAESFPALSDLFNVQISYVAAPSALLCIDANEIFTTKVCLCCNVVNLVHFRDEEAVEYFASDVNGGDENSSSRSSSRILRETRRPSLVSTLADGMKSAVNAVSSYFGSGGQQHSSIHNATVEKNGIITKSDRNVAARNDHSIAKFFRRCNQESVVEIDDPSQMTTFADESEVKKSNLDDDLERKSRIDSAEMLTKSQARDAVTQALEAKRSTTLLTYPYEDSESAVGKISVTYGDIARLAPGEFLNDNIIDFYLR